MKKTFLLSVVVGMLSVPSVFAVTLTLEGSPSGYGPYQTGIGGEFTFGISDGNLISGYSPLTMNQGDGAAPSFQTFCVEGGENINSGSPTYTANYNNQSVFSNVPLTKGAAWLYSQFATAGNFG